jgi:hypothetical protein
MLRLIWQHIKPPSGCEVRRVIAWTLLAYGIVRVLKLQSAGHEVLTLLPWWMYGWSKILIAIALLITNQRYRTTWIGRIVATTAFALCVALVVDAYPVWNGMMTYVLLALFLITEVVTTHDC